MSILTTVFIYLFKLTLLVNIAILIILTLSIGIGTIITLSAIFISCIYKIITFIYETVYKCIKK